MTDDGKIKTPTDLLGQPRRRLSLAEVALLLGYSKERVRQIEKQALYKMARSPILKELSPNLFA